MTAAADDRSAPLPARTVSEGVDVAALFRRHVRFVWRSLRYLGVRERDLDDTCQEVFLVAHRRAAVFRGESSASTWLYGICVRVAAAHRRKAHVRRELPAEEPPEPDAAEAPQQRHAEDRQFRQQLLRALDQLDQPKREVFVLFEIEELPMKSIAEALDVPLQTAYSRLQAARKELAAAFDEETR